MPILSI
jgi:proton-translocating NADH-quinone oxidoreductase chain M